MARLEAPSSRPAGAMAEKKGAVPRPIVDPGAV